MNLNSIFRFSAKKEFAVSIFLVGLLLSTASSDLFAEDQEEAKVVPSIQELMSQYINFNNGLKHLQRLASVYAGGSVIKYENGEEVKQKFKMYKKY